MRRSAPVFLVGFVGFALAVTGCILGIDNLSGGGGSSGDDASDDAVSADASTSDGGAGDSSTIKTVDSGNDGGRFCPQAGALLCSDFDDPDIDASVPGPWDFSYAPGTAQVAATAAEFQSAPRSLIMTTTGSALAASMSKDVLSKHVVLSFDLFIAARGGNSGFATFNVGGAGALTFQPTSDTQSNILEADTTADGGTIYNTTSGPEIMTGKWIHADCMIDLPTHTATLSINGTQTISRTLAVAKWSTASNVSVAIGFGDSSSETLYYDNVTITTS